MDALQSNFPIDSLPYEAFQNVLSQFSSLNLTPLCLVSKKWNAAIEENFLRRLPESDRNTVTVTKALAEKQYFKLATLTCSIDELSDLLKIADNTFINNQNKRAFAFEADIFKNLKDLISSEAIYPNTVEIYQILKSFDKRRQEAFLDFLNFNQCFQEAETVNNILAKKHEYKDNTQTIIETRLQIPEELFQKILSYQIDLKSISYVNKDWMLSTQQQLLIRFPNEKRKSIEFVKALVGYNYLNAAIQVIKNIISDGKKEKINSKQIFEFAKTHFIFPILFKIFENLLSFQIESLKKEALSLYPEFIKEFDANLHSMEHCLQVYQAKPEILGKFYSSFLWPFLKKALESNNDEIVGKLFNLIKNKHEKLFWSMIRYSVLFKDIVGSISKIKDLRLKLDLFKSVAYSFYDSLILNSLFSEIIDFKKIDNSFNYALESFNFPIFFHIFFEEKINSISHFIQKNYLDFELYVNFNKSEELYPEFLKNLNANLLFMRHFLKSCTEDSVIEFFSVEFYWPLLIRAFQEESIDNALKIYSLISEGVVIQNYPTLIRQALCKKNNLFFNFASTIFNVKDKSLKVRILDLASDHFLNQNASDLELILPIFMISDHFFTINETDKAKALEAKIFAVMLSLISENSRKANLLINLAPEKLEHFQKMLLENKSYKEAENLASILPSKQKEGSLYLIFEQKVQALIETQEWEQAKSAIYHYRGLNGCNFQKASELLFSIETEETKIFSEKQAEYLENQEVAEALKEQQSHYVDDDEDYYLSDEEYNPSDYSSGSDVESENDDELEKS